MPCPICDDTGWKAVEEGGIRRVMRCECWRRQKNVDLLREARIPERYAHCNLDSFRDYTDSLASAVRKARALVEAFPDPRNRGLLLMGPPGVGKTHLAVAIVRLSVQQRGARCLFYDVRDLLKLIRSTYNPIVKTTELEVLRPVMACDLLVLDDLGAEKTSEWVEETLNLIVNTRYNEQRLSVFTTNYSDEADERTFTLDERIGTRMRSRLYEMCDTVILKGIDFRRVLPDPTREDLAREMARSESSGKNLSPRPRPARAQLRDGKADLKWPGGRAGSV
jgi:DNA replication protein DnaC